MTSLAKRIEQAALARGIPPRYRGMGKVIAAHMNVTQQSVSRWLNAKATPKIGLLRKLANYLNVKLTYLVEAVN